MTHALDSALEEARSAELRRAARALLRQPLLRAGAEAEDFRLVRRHAGELRSWFDANTGWRLIVDSEVARLVKIPPTIDDPTHPARDPRSRTPFSRRRYVLTCLALSVLERSDAQITLGRLAEGVIVAAADERLARAGVAFRLNGREERADLVAVVRLLLELGVLARVAGDEEAFVRDAGDALYDVQRRVLAVVLAAPHGPSTISAQGFAERLSQLAADPLPETEDLRNRALRQHLTRRLLDDPVLYIDELDAAQSAYLTGQRAALTRRISELTGLVAEVRAEGIAMVDPDDDMTDVRMPEVGTDGHVTLLLAEHLAQRAAQSVPEPDLHLLVRRLAEEHSAYWRRSAREPGAEVLLVDMALERLAALRLIRRGADGVKPLPALARYALAAPTIAEEHAQLELGA
jgi:uncharacterized protein (TIGR02678 family)